MRSMRWFGVAAVLCVSAFSKAEISKADGEAFAYKIQDLIAARDAAGFTASFDQDKFLASVFRGIQHPELQKAKQGFREGIRDVGGQLCRAFTEPSDGIVFLHMRKIQEKPVLTFRIDAEAGTNYWDLYVDDSTGVIKITDLHIAATGEDLSQTMQRLVLRMLSAAPGEMTPADRQMMADMQELVAQVRAGKGEEALAVADRLPEKMKKEKFIQIMRVQAAIILDDPDRTDAVCEEFRTQFGNDPACDLLMIDTFMRRKKLEEAIACIDRLDASVGSDPFLDIMRGNLYLTVKTDYATARRYFNQALKRDPNLFDAADAMFSLALTEKDYPEMKRIMLMMENHPVWAFAFDDELGGGEEFAGFKQSPHYKAWLQERQQR